MISIITNNAQLSPSVPYKKLEHNTGDGIILDDTIDLVGPTTSPNSRTTIDRQLQYLKIMTGRAIIIYYQEPPNVDLGAMHDTYEFSEWKNSRIFIADDRVLIHKFDMHPADQNAELLSRDGFLLSSNTDELFLRINQDDGTNNITVWY